MENVDINEKKFIKLLLSLSIKNIGIKATENIISL